MGDFILSYVRRDEENRAIQDGRFHELRPDVEAPTPEHRVFRSGNKSIWVRLWGNSPTSGGAARRFHLSLSRNFPSRNCHPRFGASEISDDIDFAFPEPTRLSVIKVYEGDINRDGKKDYLVTLSMGISILFERNGEPTRCALD